MDTKEILTVICVAVIISIILLLVLPFIPRELIDKMNKLAEWI